MYWILAVAFPVIGLLIVWIVLSTKWTAISGERDSLAILQKSAIQMVQTFLPTLPGHPGYLDLKFSALRHAIVFIIIAALLHSAEGFWETLLLAFYLLYTASLWWRYSVRKREIRSEACLMLHASSQVIARTLVKDSFSVVLFGTTLAALSYVLLFFKSA